VKRDLSAAGRAGRNPPTIQAVAAAAGVQVPPARSIINTTTVTGSASESNCFRFREPANRPEDEPRPETAHCNVSAIDLNGGNRTLTVDTTDRPVYLYVSGNISLQGNANIAHIRRRGSEPDEVIPERYTTARGLTVDTYREDVFRFQIRGIPVTSSSSSQTISFQGSPTSNLLFWAPAANLTLGGTVDFSAALYVNSFSTGGNARINLVGTPGGFTDLDDNIKSFTASSVIFTQFF
jgi:hypothetical protein